MSFSFCEPLAAVLKLVYGGFEYAVSAKRVYLKSNS